MVKGYSHVVNYRVAQKKYTVIYYAKGVHFFWATL